MAIQLDKKIEQLQDLVENWFHRYNITAAGVLPVSQRPVETNGSPDEFLIQSVLTARNHS